MGLSNRHQVQGGHTRCGGHKGCHTHPFYFCHCVANHTRRPYTTSVTLNSMGFAVDYVADLRGIHASAFDLQVSPLCGTWQAQAAVKFWDSSIKTGELQSSVSASNHPHSCQFAVCRALRPAAAGVASISVGSLCRLLQCPEADSLSGCCPYLVYHDM